MRSVFELKKWVQDKPLEKYPTISPILALQTSLDYIQETRLQGHQGPIDSVVFSPDGQLSATGSDDGTARIWNTTGRQLAQFEEAIGIPSPDWQKIAIVSKPSNSDDQVVRLYRLDTNLDSLLSRACQRLKYYLLYSPNLKDDRDRCKLQDER